MKFHPKKEKSKPMHNNDKGFTLLELMVVITVLAILLSIAIPSFQSFLANSRLNSAAEKAYRIFNTARQEAISSGLNAMVCKSNSNPINDANPGCGTVNTTSWDYGFLSYRSHPDVTHPNPNARLGNFRINHNSFTSALSLTERISIVINSFNYDGRGINYVASADQRVIAFASDGTLINSVNNVVPFRIAVCDDRGESHGQYIEINAVGRIFIRNTRAVGGVNCNATAS